MPSEREIDNYINNMEEENAIYVDKELEYADSCHKLEEKISCPLDVFIKAHTQGVYCLDQKRGGLKWNLRGFSNATTDFDGNHLLGFFDNRLPYKKDGLKSNFYYWKDYKKTWWLSRD